MYLHVGQAQIIPTDSIVGIFDLDNASHSHLTRDFLARYEKRGAVVNVSEELPKSFVLCRDLQGERLYISQLSSATLLRRAENGFFET